MLNRLFRVERGEWGKLLQFGLFGLMLQTGLGIGFAAGDAAFLSHVGPAKLPVIFLLTPPVMVVYTAIFSFLQVRFSFDRVVDVTLALLAAGGLAFAWLLETGPKDQVAIYYALKLYLAMWYIGLYTLFWNFTDAFFDIQDAKRLFPLFAAFCALGVTFGSLIVSALAGVVSLPGFLAAWAAIAGLTAPVAMLVRRRFARIADSDTDLDAESRGVAQQLLLVFRTFRASPYALMLTATLFVTLLLTNLIEFQYSSVLQKGRSEAELASLFGGLYAATSGFNLIVCLFVFNRLVGRMGVRNVALILPATYFAVFAYFFLAGGEVAALAAFFAYHGVLTSIEYNNQNLLFNATPSAVKRPFRTVVEGLAEPLASLVAGGFLLLVAKAFDVRELSGVGVLLGAALIGVVVALRHLYPAAMEANMRHGWLNFGDPAARTPRFDADAVALLEAKTREPDSGAAAAARELLRSRTATSQAPAQIDPEISAATDEFAGKLADPSPSVRRYAVSSLASVVGHGDIHLVGPLVANLPRMDRASRETILKLLAVIGDVEAIPQILPAAAQLSPRELRATEDLLAGLGEAAIPRLAQALGADDLPYRARALAARALSALSQAQFLSQLDRLVREELAATGRRLESAQALEAGAGTDAAVRLLARAYRERIGASVDFVLELLALGGQLPDFDLLIVSLHSANPKVRGNAIEAIASGVDHATWRLLEPLVTRRGAGRGVAGDLLHICDEAVASGRLFEAAAAAQAMARLLPPEALATRLRPALEPDMPPALRRGVSILLSLEPASPTLVDLVQALATRPEFAPATLDALTALAERATPAPQGRRPTELLLAGGSWWLARADVDEVAARHPDLALAMLKARDGRSYAA
ncbi:Npt1/Npt2 family nucleotide transporter [Phenylobacterium sp.]|uniref:Npt1/Npt2 family nucleotide transporter n=1 Tax=Phenylobacterium sp. TaxID=1871053 RepID=UPI0025F4CC74|nr:Npt1/Npt2 family nucleotide transporter [Phenylobacterium sp.]MBX3485385.1 hypothetical protein [Phenylobacterium sp.]MCW5760553.1 hypothetical protein [Phenylobacterium sp.]